MTGSSRLKKQRKLHLTQNNSTPRRIFNSVTKKTLQLQNDLISDGDQPAVNERFTYKTRTFAGTSYQKLSNYLDQQNTDVNEDEEHNLYKKDKSTVDQH